MPVWFKWFPFSFRGTIFSCVFFAIHLLAKVSQPKPSTVTNHVVMNKISSPQLTQVLGHQGTLWQVLLCTIISASCWGVCFLPKSIWIQSWDVGVRKMMSFKGRRAVHGCLPMGRWDSWCCQLISKLHGFFPSTGSMLKSSYASFWTRDVPWVMESTFWILPSFQHHLWKILNTPPLAGWEGGNLKWELPGPRLATSEF